MQRRLQFMTMTAAVLIALAGSIGRAAEKDAEWVLVWSDEFEKPKLDLTHFDTEFQRSARKFELQYFTPDSLSFQNGCMRLTTQKRAFGGAKYTSGTIKSKDRFSQTYGRFEVRTRLPRSQAIWPACWLASQAADFPPDIVIYELLGHEPQKVYLTNRWASTPLDYKGGSYAGPDFGADFHVFAVEWTPGEIKWFVDGTERYTTKEGVSNRPCYLVLNTAVGGPRLKNPDSNSLFPQFHDIDYVRVYRRAKDIVPPSIQLLKPAGDLTVSVVQEVNLRASASDTDPATVKVAFMLSALSDKNTILLTTKVREFTTPPFDHNFKITKPGRYWLYATVSDAAHKPVNTKPLNVLVKPDEPMDAGAGK